MQGEKDSLGRSLQSVDHSHRCLIFDPTFDGIEKRAYFLRTINDSLKIKEFLSREKPQKVAIIGGGYIGLEMTENFLHMGCQVTLIERAPHIIPNMDEDMAQILTAYLVQQGVDVRIGETARLFRSWLGKGGNYRQGGNPGRFRFVIHWCPAQF